MRSLPLILAVLALAACGGDEGGDAQPAAQETGAVATTTTTEEDGETTTEVVVEQAPIVVESPQPGETVSNPIRVSGTASVFEATVAVRVAGADGETLGEATITAETGAPERGDFSGLVPVDVDEAQDATLEVFSPSAEDGSEQHKVTVPIRVEP